MSKPIINKEVSDYGTITLKFCGRDGRCDESMNFDSEVQLQAFSYFLILMVSMNAASVEVE